MARARAGAAIVEGAGGASDELDAKILLEELAEHHRAGASVQIRRQFIDTSSLEDVGKMATDYRNRLATLDSQLRSAQQGKLAGAGQAEDTVGALSTDMGALRGEYKQLRSLCTFTQDLLAPYPKIRAASAARHNLRDALGLIDRYNQVPEEIEDLTDLLGEPLMLKEVWIQTQRLLQWRDGMMDELKKAAARAREASSSFSSSAATAEEGLDYNSLVQVLSVHFSRVTDLRQGLIEAILDKVGRHVELAEADQQAVLVQSLEVVELVEALQALEVRRAVAEATQADNHDELAVLHDEETARMRLNHVDLRKQVVALLEKSIHDVIPAQYMNFHMELADSGASSTQAKLGAATELLRQLRVIKNLVEPCFPPAYAILSKYRYEIEKLLVPEIQALYDDRSISNLEPEELLAINEFLDYYNESMQSIGEDGTCQSFEEGASVVLAKYLESMEAQMKKWVENIFKGKSFEVRTGLDKSLFTNMPEMLFQVVHTQIGVVKDRLSGVYLRTAFLKVLGVLHSEQDRAKNALDETVADSSNGEPVAIDWLAANVNDCARLQEKTSEVLESAVDDLVANDKLTQIGAEVLRDEIESLYTKYTEHATVSTSYIASVIMYYDLQSVFEGLFLPEWEASTSSGMSTVAATYRDYFEDLRTWLPEYFFCKLCRQCFEQVVVRYVEDLVSHARVGKRPFQKPESAAKSIRSDRQEIFDFFSEYEDELEQAGIRPPKMSIEERVEVLDWISVVVETVPNDVQDLSSVEDVNSLTGAIGCEGVAALVQLHPEGHKMSSEERAELHEALKAAEYTLKSLGGADEAEEGRFILSSPENSAGGNGKGGRSFLSSAVARAREMRGAGRR